MCLRSYIKSWNYLIMFIFFVQFGRKKRKNRLSVDQIQKEYSNNDDEENDSDDDEEGDTSAYKLDSVSFDVSFDLEWERKKYLYFA